MVLNENVVKLDNYVKDLRLRMDKPDEDDPQLKSFLDKIYIDGANIGSGSTTDAVRYEKQQEKKLGEENTYKILKMHLNFLKNGYIRMISSDQEKQGKKSTLKRCSCVRKCFTRVKGCLEWKMISIILAL